MVISINCEKHIPEDICNAVSTFGPRIYSSLCLMIRIIFIHMHSAASLHAAKTKSVSAACPFHLVAFNHFICSAQIPMILALPAQKFGAMLPPWPRPLAN